jgi:hypothetical protein
MITTLNSQIVYCQRRLFMGVHNFSPKLSVSNLSIAYLIAVLLEEVLFHHLHDIKLPVFKNKPLGSIRLTAIKCNDNRLFKPP